MVKDYITTPTNRFATDRAREALVEGEQTVLVELQRGDTKASNLLTFFGAVLAGVVVLAQTRVSPAAIALLYLAAIPTAAAVVLLLWVLRPVFGGTRAGFTRWAQFTDASAALVADLARPRAQHIEDRAHHLAVLSALVTAKYRRITVAVHLLLLGMAITALALLAA